MPQCAILNCNNTHRKTRGGSVRYHRFPGDPETRFLWVQACGRHVNNCSTARVCSLHFSTSSYERDVQHELLGLPLRSRLRKGALPERNLPLEKSGGEEVTKNGIAVLLAVGLRPSSWELGKRKGRKLGSLNKMHVTEDNPVSEEQNAQPSNEEEQLQNIPSDETSNSSQHNTEEPHSNGIDEDVQPTPEQTTKQEEDDDEDTSTHNGEKRKTDGDANEDVRSAKRLRTDLEQNFLIRDKILNECIDNAACASVQQVETHMEQVLSEIKMLNELAREKEKEWNNIIHLKKYKEELLLRIQRRKQVMLLTDDEPQPDILKNIKAGNGLMIFSTNQAKKPKHLNTFMELTNGFGNSKLNYQQRPVIDVQSIIADYRQRHPEAVPRRGRRIRSLLNSQGDNAPITVSSCSNARSSAEQGGVINVSSMLLGSGAQVKHNLNATGMDVNGEMSVLLSGAEESHELHPSGKPPPPYSEVTVHPVIPLTTQSSSNSSLLHGILTKTNPKPESTKSTYSPTLARLLTAPDRSTDSPQAASLSINDMLSNNKARNEITITPVVGQFDLATAKDKNDEDIEDTSDRLVIDESDITETRSNGLDELVDEVPQCQGCNQKAAQFVCAGCGNQWYCSRECQVIAWDEHSEVCSG